MSTVAATTSGGGLGIARRMRYAVTDGFIITKRNLTQIRRIPALLVFSTIQPVMFVILFRFVFGGAITGLPPSVDYVVFLMPGIFVQTAIFGSTQTGIGLSEDLNKGIIDRFRSLPMARSAVLAGRTTADLLRNLFVVLLMIGVGYLVGFEFQAGFVFAVLGILLGIFVGFTFSWISATIGLLIKNTESVQAASFIWIFPLTFASSAFVPVATMPSWLQVWARHNPVTIWVNTIRSLVLNDQAVAAFGFSRTALAAKSMLWIGGLLAIFMPLAIRAYRRA
jgi:ABC transporter DrrB family efflux protein